MTINQKNFLLFLYVIILGIFGPAIYWISNADTKFSLGEKSVDTSIQNRISVGDKILVTAHNSAAKQAGTEAFAQGDYVTASEKLNLSLKSDRNDPEARIYLNNTTAAKTETPYQVGVSVPIGGNLDVAQEILRGVAQAQAEINQEGGIKGNLLMVKIANDDNDSEVALEIADKFIKDKKVLAVVGHNSSDTSLATAPQYQEEGLVMITPTSSAESIPKVGDYIFRATPNTRALTEPLAEYAVKTLGKTNIAVCFDSESASIKSFKDEFTWSVFNLGGKIAALDCDFSSPDFLAEEMPSKIVSSGADALLLAPSLRKIDQAIAVAQASKQRLTLLGSHTLNTYSTLKEGQDATKGMILAVAWNPLSQTAQPNKAQNKFSADAQKLWGGSVNWRTAMAYDAAKTIFTGMNTRDTREGLQQTIQNPQFVAMGATSEISFLPSGDRNLKGTLIKIQPGKKSGTNYDFVPLEQPQENSVKSQSLGQTQKVPPKSSKN